MKVFVTGATGLLGANLVHQLATEGHQVTALARSPEKAGRAFAGIRVNVVQGDMEDVPAFADHLKGAEVVFHAAAYFREYYGKSADHWMMLEKINVHGTIEVLEAAEKAGVGKVVYVSSSGVIGANTGGRPSDETTPADKLVMDNLYFRSKLHAEQAVDRFLETHSIPVTMILPGAIFGPRDAAPTASGEFILEFLKGKLPAIPPGGFTTVDARDVAQALIAAVERGKHGERYIVADQFYSSGDILRLVSQAAGIRPPSMPTLPATAGLAFAHVSEWMASLRQTPPQVTVAAMRTLIAAARLSSAKATRELGFQTRPFATTIADTVRWFQDHGYLDTNAVPRKSA